VPATLIDNIGGEKSAIASIDSLQVQGDLPLVAAAKNGNLDAFEVLVARHEQKIFFVARRITRTREDAEDVVQQTLQKAFTHLSKFEQRASFSTWLTRVAINEALMLLRKRRGRHEVMIDDVSGEKETPTVLEVPDSGLDPEVKYSRLERERILSSVMNELPNGTRKAIQLRELDERSTEETARIMGISIGAVKARVFHGRRKLRERLKRFVEPTWTSARKTSLKIGNSRRISRDQVAWNACG